MKSRKALIAEDNHALRKLDTLIDEEDPFEKEPGGSAYAPREKGATRITAMYNDNRKEDKRKRLKEIAAGALVVTVAIILITIIVLLIRM